ncbi:Cytochrome o ubiquinol oxidase protein CyoD [Candidatus Portiera aleyrodidarum]|uniref:Cytochrome bo(3) ubiquinol oxidase subunit 4 n=1 Tax=Candidatus Portiera aleyrodidarum TaxID=91844 RepID=A0A6S6RTU5_9GAMM|nr:cytochrome C oxidase subunit IV family protein [Candidatus Portiera aleyrodidarum]CAA3710466.1 Cytochrome o ubiquinol oxidase protein CyoD [Candidatus Portiera aleyrodidarum]
MNLKHLKDCIIGFIISLLLTALAYMVVVGNIRFPNLAIKIIIALFAILQIVVQMIYFVNIKEISQLDTNIYVGSLLFTLTIMFIILGGSLWIFSNINGK